MSENHALSDSRLADLVAQSPAVGRVFHRYRIDFCCQGHRTLREACDAAQLDTADLVRQIESEQSATTDASVASWGTEPLDALMDHLIRSYHDPLRPELERLVAMARKVQDVHGGKDARLGRLASVLESLASDLVLHLEKEEKILFPWIRRRDGRPTGPIAVMFREHDDTAYALRELAALTDGYQTPPEACATWNALYSGLAALERDLKDHIHLENHVLFPRALDS